jgi:hypothetical protein
MYREKYSIASRIEAAAPACGGTCARCFAGRDGRRILQPTRKSRRTTPCLRDAQCWVGSVPLRARPGRCEPGSRRVRRRAPPSISRFHAVPAIATCTCSATRRGFRSRRSASTRRRKRRSSSCSSSSATFISTASWWCNPASTAPTMPAPSTPCAGWARGRAESR